MITVLLILLSIVFIVVSTSKFNLHPFLALLIVSFGFGLLSGMPAESVLTAISEGFGGTIGKLGIIIITGIIIGTFLEKSGGAYTLANAVLKIVGSSRVHTAMAIIGYIVSIPVFADSGFVILSSLNKALSKKAGVSLAGTAIALALGLMASHTMVPPTPGPIAAAGIIGADLGTVILVGVCTSICSLIVIVFFSKKIGKMIHIDPEPDLSDSEIESRIQNGPTPFKAFIPILVPIILIVLKSISEYPTAPFGEGDFKSIIGFIGNPIVALFVGMFFSFFLPKKWSKDTLGANGWIGEALQSAAIILLITGAGGAFGKVLQSSDIGAILGGMVKSSGLGIWLPFLVAAAIKSAQGSSTVALITTASIIAPLTSSMGLDTDLSKAIVVIAIGAGSAVASHVNDSFFWVVTQMTGMNVKQGYQIQTAGSALLGFTAMLFLTVLNLFT